MDSKPTDSLSQWEFSLVCFLARFSWGLPWAWWLPWYPFLVFLLLALEGEGRGIKIGKRSHFSCWGAVGKLFATFLQNYTSDQDCSLGMIRNCATLGSRGFLLSVSWGRNHEGSASPPAPLCPWFCPQFSESKKSLAPRAELHRWVQVFSEELLKSKMQFLSVVTPGIWQLIGVFFSFWGWSYISNKFPLSFLDSGYHHEPGDQTHAHLWLPSPGDSSVLLTFLVHFSDGGSCRPDWWVRLTWGEYTMRECLSSCIHW